MEVEVAVPLVQQDLRVLQFQSLEQLRIMLAVAVAVVGFQLQPVVLAVLEVVDAVVDPSAALPE
jgi:hypothetical protein